MNKAPSRQKSMLQLWKEIRQHKLQTAIQVEIPTKSDSAKLEKSNADKIKGHIIISTLPNKT